jgi:hypothetical protein
VFTQFSKLLTVCVLMLFTDGCSRAPSINVVGSFLPSWMLCLGLGVLVSAFTRWQLMQRKLEHRVMPVVVFYPSLVVATACLLWLLFFR